MDTGVVLYIGISEAAKILGRDPRRLQLRARDEGWVGVAVEGRRWKRFPLDLFPADWREELAVCLEGQAGEFKPVHLVELEPASVAAGVEEAGLESVELPGVEVAPLGLPAELPMKSEPVERPQGVSRNDLRLLAAARIYGVLQECCQRGEVNVRQCYCQFAMDYNDRRLGLEEWLYEVFPTLSWATLQRRIVQPLMQQRSTEAFDGRARVERRGKIASDPVLKRFVDGLLVKFPHLSDLKLLRLIEHDFPGVGLSRGALLRYRQELNGSLAYQSLVNPDGFRNRFQPAFGTHRKERPLQCLAFDETPADVMLVDGRFSVVAAIDEFDGWVKAVVAPARFASTDTIASLFHKIVTDRGWGVPESVKTDNGKVFTAHRMARVFEALSVQHVLCPPFTPEAKGAIERWFRTLSHDLFETLPGYVGHNVADRREIEGRRSFAARMGSDRPAIELGLTAAELQRKIDEFIEIYHARESAALGGKSPKQVRAEARGGWQQRWVTDENLLRMLLATGPDRAGVRKVGKAGIRCDNGLYAHEELGAWIGSDVRVIHDPLDWGRVQVYALDWAAICVAEDVTRQGATRRIVTALGAKENQKEALAEERARLRRAARDGLVVSAPERQHVTELGEARQVEVLSPERVELQTPALMSAAKLQPDLQDKPLEVQALSQLDHRRMAKQEQEERDEATRLQELAQSPDRLLEAWEWEEISREEWGRLPSWQQAQYRNYVRHETEVMRWNPLEAVDLMLLFELPGELLQLLDRPQRWDLLDWAKKNRADRMAELYEKLPNLRQAQAG